MRPLAGALDALIRSVRTQLAGAAADEQGRRLVAIWRDAAWAPIAVEAVSLRAGELVILSASADGGRWILPAFMSGLRELRPRSEVSADDAVRLAEHLGAIAVDAAAFAVFQNWVWSEGAEGFDLKLESTFIELFDARFAASVAEAQAVNIAAVRAVAMVPADGETHNVSSEDVDIAALRPELEVAIDLYATAARSRGLEVSGATLRALGTGCDDPTSWAIAEIDAVLANLPLRHSFPAERLARRILGQVTRRCDARLLGALTAMRCAEDPYVARTLVVLESIGAGTQIGHATRLDEVTSAAALATWLATAPERLARDAVRGLLRREESSGDIARFLADLLVANGADWWLAVVEPRSLEPIHAGLFGDVLTRIAPPSSTISGLLAELPPATSAALATRLPARMLEPHADALGALMWSAPIDTALALFDAVPVAALAPRLAERVRKDRGQGWTAPHVARLVTIWLRMRLDPAPLAALVRVSQINPATRLSVLLALAPAREAQANAARWRFGELFEPPSLRHALREARNSARQTQP